MNFIIDNEDTQTVRVPQEALRDLLYTSQGIQGVLLSEVQ